MSHLPAIPPAPGRFRRATRVVAARARAIRRAEQGMTTAEYAVGTVAAASFGGLLFKLLTSDTVQNLLLQIVEYALKLAFGH